MKWYRSADGEQRIWYTETEIEQIVEDELARAQLTPRSATPVADLEAFIESHLDADLDQYADLPADVLGLTRFEPGSRPVVLINAELTSVADEAEPGSGARGRFRATMAHEAAHVFLHRYLFDPVLNQDTLFEMPPTSGQRPAGGLMRCLKRDVGMTARSDWREVQANRGMAALLMPRAVFRRLAFRVVADAGLGPRLRTGSAAADALAGRLAEVFEVSKQAASIRLETMGILADANTTLPGL